MNKLKEFEDIKSFMKFIMNFPGELIIKGLDVYFHNDKVATLKIKN